MDTLRGAVTTLLLTAVCAMLFRFLLPEGSVSRTAKTVVSLVTLCAVCAPLFSLWGNLSGREDSVSGFSVFSEDKTTFPYGLMEQEAGEAVKAACDSIISKYTDAPREIDVSVHIPEGGGIEIERIRIVFGSPPEGREAMAAELTDCCGKPPEIRVKTADE